MYNNVLLMLPIVMTILLPYMMQVDFANELIARQLEGNAAHLSRHYSSQSPMDDAAGVPEKERVRPG